MDISTQESACEPSRQRFMTTSWTIVSRATGEDGNSREAMAFLCRAYWYPLYQFYRRYRQTRSESGDGEDIVQSFFVWLIESNVIERADADRGRFRTFLLATFKQFLSRQSQYQSAAKRQPSRPIVSIDELGGKDRAPLEPFHDMTPEKIFDYTWALEVIEHAMGRLREEWLLSGRLDRFELLRHYLAGAKEIRGKELAKELGITEGAVRVAIHRLRQRYAELLRDEVRRTAASDADLDSELKYLFQVLQG